MKHIFHEDRLVRRWTDEYGVVRHHGKRVSADCPMRRDEVRAYVVHGAIAAVKLIRVNRRVSVSEAYNILKQARGHVKLTWETRISKKGR